MSKKKFQKGDHHFNKKNCIYFNLVKQKWIVIMLLLLMFGYPVISATNIDANDSIKFTNYNQSLMSNEEKHLDKKRKLNTVTVSSTSELISAINNVNGNNLNTININANTIQFTGSMQEDSAIYLKDKQVDINGIGTNKVELRGEGASDKYRIFYINGGVVNLKNLRITNGYAVSCSFISQIQFSLKI